MPKPCCSPSQSPPELGHLRPQNPSNVAHPGPGTAAACGSAGPGHTWRVSLQPHQPPHFAAAKFPRKTISKVPCEIKGCRGQKGLGRWRGAGRTAPQSISAPGPRARRFGQGGMTRAELGTSRGQGTFPPRPSASSLPRLRSGPAPSRRHRAGGTSPFGIISCGRAACGTGHEAAYPFLKKRSI